jgi:predicted Rossmann-fold nucleotide-binding protein
MEGFVFQEVDFSHVTYFPSLPVQGASFWACKFPSGITSGDVRKMGARYVTSNPSFVPFKPCRAFLYAQEEMIQVDRKIYQFYLEESTSFSSQLAMSVHDFSIMDALMDYAEGKSFVAICGGHNLLRATLQYRQVMELGNRIANAGFVTLSGGGPGAMEASNLGAYIAGVRHRHHSNSVCTLASITESADAETNETIVSPSTDDQPISPLTTESIPQDDRSTVSVKSEVCNHLHLDRAWEIMKSIPSPPDRPEYENLLPAQAVIKEFGPTKCYTPSLGIPTWRYGHEPPNLFTAYHAKFFQNSIREDVLLDMCYGGLIMTPGGPGTMQEVFQAACRCAYAQEGREYPIVFYGVDYWRESGIWDIIYRQSQGRKYHNYLLLSDSIDEIMNHLVKCALEKDLTLIDDFSKLDNPYWYSKHGPGGGDSTGRLSSSSQNSLF